MKLHPSIIVFFLFLFSALISAENKRYALLIGINDYIDSGIVDLTTPRNDANDIARALSNWDKVFVMTDDLDLRGPDAPIRGNIENRLSLLSELTNENDTILVFFSGHGYSTPAGDARILPLDAGITRLGDTTIPIASMDATLNSNGKRNVVFMLDACRETLSATKGLQVVGVGGGMQSKINAFYATKAGWYSFEDSNKRNGVFTRFLLEGLSGAADTNHDSKITIGELAAWLPGAAGDYALTKGIRQKPYVSILGVGIADVVLASSSTIGHAPNDSGTLGRGTRLLRFEWQYNFEPEPGRRYWYQTNSNDWTEEYPSGQRNYFTFEKSFVLDGVQGSIVRSLSNGDFRLFIPGRGQSNNWFKMNLNNEKSWRPIAQIKYLD